MLTSDWDMAAVHLKADNVLKWIIKTFGILDTFRFSVMNNPTEDVTPLRLTNRSCDDIFIL